MKTLANNLFKKFCLHLFATSLSQKILVLANLKEEILQIKVNRQELASASENLAANTQIYYLLT